jgi:PIN domain nuclease of toxin-antitoxin system
VIVLDTQVWIWWTMGDSFRLLNRHVRAIDSEESGQIGISAISCWEVAKLVELRKLQLPIEVSEWFRIALQYPRTTLLELTPDIATESTRLPGKFHRDPADQIIVATARILECPLLTTDQKIISYPHVQTI